MGCGRVMRQNNMAPTRHSIIVGGGGVTKGYAPVFPARYAQQARQLRQVSPKTLQSERDYVRTTQGF